MSKLTMHWDRSEPMRYEGIERGMQGQTKTGSTNGNLNKSGGQMGLELEKGMRRVKLS